MKKAINMITKFIIEYYNTSFGHMIRGPYPIEELETQWNYFFHGIDKSNFNLREHKSRTNFKIIFE